MSINTHRIALVLRKEWLELRQQKSLIAGTVILPLIFTLLPLGVIFSIGLTSTKDINGMDSMLALVKSNPTLSGLNGTELVQAVIGQPISVILLLLPVILPSLIASYSIIGEKLSQTLEPLLATPVTTLELMLAKILTALIPTVVITWCFGGIFILGMTVATLSPGVFRAIISPSWLLLLLLCVPLLALITIAATVAISSRVNDPRSAQQISAVVILPVMMLLGGQFTGLLVLSPLVVLLVAIVLALFAAAVTWFATQLFQREAILTRWS